jgi:hypothetical protein
MSPQVDEETPLLSSEQAKRPRTPLPWFQFSIVLFLQLAEPLTSQVIYPFAPEVCLNLFTPLIADPSDGSLFVRLELHMEVKVKSGIMLVSW